MADATSFDIFEWYPAYQACQRYFLDTSQHDPPVQAVAALINILLPFQLETAPQVVTTPPTKAERTGSVASLGVSGVTAGFANLPFPLTSPTVPSPLSMNPPQSPLNPQPPSSHTTFSHPPPNPAALTLMPYIRRLVVTGFDTESILHGFFGSAWRKGIGPLQECERRNYLFTAKSVGWAQVKEHYDMGPYQTCPFLRPLQGVRLAEIEAAERGWSSWLAMEDWMVGPRDPDGMCDGIGGIHSEGLRPGSNRRPL